MNYLKPIKASEIVEGQKIRLKIKGEWKTEAVVTSVIMSSEGKVLIRAAHWFIGLNPSDRCILVEKVMG